jgi:hypothetical protein
MHMLNMELDLQSLFGLRVQRYSMAETPHLPPLPIFGLINEGAIGQPRYTTSLCNPLVYVWGNFRPHFLLLALKSNYLMLCFKKLL